MKSFNEVFKCDSITLNISNKCPLNCIYCFEGNKNGTMMSFDMARQIIDTAYNKVDGPQKFTVNLFGGEPFTNWPVIKQLIDYCNEMKYQIHFAATTNLYILTDEMIKYIDDNSMNLLVSIDGIKEVHDRNRDNSYDVVVKNIKRLMDAGCGILLEGRLTIPPNEVSHMFDGVKNLWDMGFNSLCPMPVTDMEWSKEQLDEFRIQTDKVLRFYMEKVQDMESNRNIYIKNTDELLGNVLDPLVYDPFMCPITSSKWCVFDPNGDIYQCHQIPYNEDAKQYIIGNINTGVDETKVMSTEILASFDRDECQGCKAKSICKSGCPIENIRETGDMKTPTDSYCAIKRIQLEVADTARDELLSAKSLKSRFLNIVRLNLEVKKYCDDVLCKTSPTDFEFELRLLHLQDMTLNLKKENILIPSFQEYLNKKVMALMAFFAAQIKTVKEEMDLKEED